MEEVLKKRLQDIEIRMQSANFWDEKEQARETINEYNQLKNEALGVEKYDRGSAILTIFAGAGGDDSEDFARMLFEMYYKYIGLKGWEIKIIHEHTNDVGGIRNKTIEIIGNNVYGMLKNESGVHRLVRISPFNAAKKRHTSFCMVEVIPKIEQIHGFDIGEADMKIEFTKAGGPGGQNVNKRETAVRVIHIPTNTIVQVSSERSQQANRDTAISILRSKLYHHIQETKKKEQRELSVSASTNAEWGSQIRSYVLHPYKMVKDHRTGVEVSDVIKILERGELDEFIEAERDL
jgi:peptide chain release factor 2